jgi:hypothetical protein
MRQSDLEDRTISSVKSGHLTSVICGQPTSVLTLKSTGHDEHAFLTSMRAVNMREQEMA